MLNGLNTRFTKGHVSWLKGKKGTHLSTPTEFKKHNLSGMAARRYKAVGRTTIRCKNNKYYRWIKISDEGPLSKRWMSYARFCWLGCGKPIPANVRVIHKDGNTLNDHLSNLVLMSHQDHIKHLNKLNLNIAAIGRNRSLESRKEKAQVHKVAKETRLAREKYTWEIIWECTSCANEMEKAKKPNRCIKCGSCSIIKSRRARPQRKAI